MELESDRMIWASTSVRTCRPRHRVNLLVTYSTFLQQRTPPHTRCETEYDESKCEYTFQARHIYSEYDAEEASVSRGFGLLRYWDFSKAEPRYVSEEARIEIAGREQAVIAYLIERQSTSA